MKKLLLVGAVMAAGAGSVTAAPAPPAPVNLITNGNFETTATSYGTATGRSYRTVAAGDPFITGWTVGGTSVDVIKNGYGAISGNSIDLLGSPGPGSISQSFTALANHRYELDFDYFRNGLTSATNYAFTVLFGGTTYAYSAANLPTTMHSTLLFDTGNTSGPSLLKFSSAPVANNSGAVIDNVSVTAIPEPETYALMLAGIGFVGFMARRRKQQQNQQIGQFAVA